MLDEQQVVRAEVLADLPGGFPLPVQRVGRDDHAVKVQSFQHRDESGDLVRLRVYFPLGHGAALGDVEGGQQVDLAAVGADGAAGGLAVRGGVRQQAGHCGLACGRGGAALLPLVPGDFGQFLRPGGRHGLQEAVKRLVERVRVDLREDPPEGPRAGRPDAAGQRVRPAAEDQQRLRGQPAAHSAIAVGESCPAAVNAHTARASTNSSGCHRPARLRGSGTSSSHSRRHRREGSPARAADKPSRGTAIREDRRAGTVLSGGQDGWYLRSSGTVPACQTSHPASEPATTHSRDLTRHPAHSGTEIKLAGAVGQEGSSSG